MRRPATCRPLCLLLAACLAALPTVPRAQSGAAAPVDVDLPATSELTVLVHDTAGEPLAGVEVVLGTPEGAIVTRSTTDPDGEVHFEELHHGYYQVAFRRDGEAYAANRVLLVEPEEEHEATFELGGFTARARDLGLSAGDEVPLLGEPAAGVAKLDEAYGPTGWAWFRTGKGVAVLIGGGAMLVGGIVALTDAEDERVPSPFQP
jgi:hypothetical protein